MSYWGSLSEENDFAFGTVGVAILRIKKRMLAEIELVSEKKYPEQSILASLECLRLLGERFPENLSVHFRKGDFEKARDAFYVWYEEHSGSIPKAHRVAVLETAEVEFAHFKELLKPARKTAND